MYKGSKVYNFGQVDSIVYRGSRPEIEDIRYLSENLGVKLIIDLTKDPKDIYLICKELGLEYLNIPMSDSEYPSPQTVQNIEQAIRDISGMSNKVYVHCAGGRHRTGVFVGMYRYIVYGWGIDKIYDEMKHYDFYTEFGHSKLKKFIFDYVSIS